MKCNLVWNHTLDFKIKHVHRASLIWNHKTVWFSITTLSCPFLNCKIQSLKYRFFQFLQIFYWFSTELVWKIWFVTLNKPQIQIGWCVLVKISNWLGKRCNLELKWLDSWINCTNWSHQIVRKTIDFKMDVINAA